MAESVGLAAGIIALIETSKKVYDYIQDVKDADGDFSQLRIEVKSVRVILVALDELVKGLDAKDHGGAPKWIPTMQTLYNTKDGPIAQLRAVLNDMLAVAGKKGMRKLLWHFEKDKVKEWLVAMERHKSALVLALQSDLNNQLSRGVTVTSISPEVEKRLRDALHLSEEACEMRARQCILDNLSFSDMHGRFEAVNEAYGKTFQWIFEHTPKKDDESFIHWLSSGKGIFHISGKMGSGKSTLMKFLCNHERTKAELRKWAGDREMVFASFFFWRHGSPLQRSLGGLYRSLLHEILTAHPELIPSVLPRQWALVKSMPGQSQMQIHMSNADMQAAFSHLIELRNLYAKHCFCFFIDGLDEYEETRQQDYKDMVDILTRWTEAAPEDVKLCVSSREINVFLRSFNTRLCLQDLTRGDMERYVRGRLSDVGKGAEADIESLVISVVYKASGIFLWVALVVKSLREQLGNNYPLATLERELEVLPDELEDLFEYLLRSLGKSMRAKAHRTFAVVLGSTTHGFNLPLDWYFFLDNYEADPEFAMKPSFGANEPSVIRRRDIARQRLNGCSKGLLEVRESRIKPKVVFTHRSVPEFLEKEETRQDMDSLRMFSPEEAIAQLFLAEVRTAHGIDPQGFVYLIIRMLHQSKADRPPYHYRDFLEFLHSTLEFKYGDAMDPTIARANILGGHWGRYARGLGSVSVASPLHISAYLGDYEFVAWKVAHDPTIIDTDRKKSLLFGWVEYGAVAESNLGCFRLLDLFLEEGVLSQSVLHTDHLIPKLDTSVELTFWQTFIVRSVFQYIPEHEIGSRFGREYHHSFGELVEKFLRLGADPHLWIWVPDEARSKELSLERIKHSRGYGYLNDCQVTIGREGQKFLYTAGIPKKTFEFIDRNAGRVTLRDLVLFWRLDNTQTLLKLIDTKLEPQEPLGKVMGEPQTSFQAGESSRKEQGVVEERVQSSKRFWNWVEVLQERQFALFLFGIVLAVVVGFCQSRL